MGRSSGLDPVKLPAMAAPASHLEKARRHHQAGNLRLAAGLYRKIGKGHRDYPRALHYLGLIAHQTGNSEQAVRLISAALAPAGEDAEMRSNLGNALAGCGRLAEARRELERATALAPDFAGAHNNLGIVLRKMGAPGEAARAFERAAGLEPGLAVVYGNWGAALVDAGELTLARGKLDRAIELNPNLADAWNNLGLLHSRRRAWQEAVRCLNRACELNPRSPGAWVNLSNVQRAFGENAAARQSAAKAIELDPMLPEAHRALAVAGRFADADAEIRRVEEILKTRTLPPGGRVHCHYALGKMLDDVGAFDRAFAAYAEANAGQARPFDPAQAAARIDGIISGFDGPLFDRLAGGGSDSERPVFVIGMPRSGTTLVEQIIASHGSAEGAGELAHFGRYLQSLPNGPGELDPAALGAFAEDYLARLGRPDAAVARIVDKRPFNFMCLGLIRLVFPRASIIHCRRDPRDTCLSIFFTDFADKHAFTTRLSDIGLFYNDYMRAMDHWRRTQPGAFLEVDYEKLVADQEAESRRLIAHCGLPWDSRCLAFHENKRPVDTPSDWQVREPIYTRSIGRWRHYEPHLAPLLEAIAPSLA